MPQMMPMLWLCLLTSCMFLLIFMISFLYFNPIKLTLKSSHSFTQMMMKKSDWKWKW